MSSADLNSATGNAAAPGLPKETESESNTAAASPELTTDPAETREDPKSMKTRLSHVSSQYDGGQKGYLTTAEQKLRDLDSQNAGWLPNDKVAGIMEQTLALRQANRALRIWVIALFVAVIMLGVANMFLAFAAADRARETNVNESTGLMTSRDSGRPIVTVSSGTRDDFDLHQDSFQEKFCAKPSQLARIWNATLAGTPTTAAFWSSSTSAVDGSTFKSSFAASFQASGSHVNETHLCFSQTNGGSACIDFRDDFCARQKRRRHLMERSPSERRQLLQAAMEGRVRRSLTNEGILIIVSGHAGESEEEEEEMTGTPTNPGLD